MAPKHMLISVLSFDFHISVLYSCHLAIPIEDYKYTNPQTRPSSKPQVGRLRYRSLIAQGISMRRPGQRRKQTVEKVENHYRGQIQPVEERQGDSW